MYAKGLLEHFRFKCDRPTICRAKTSCYGGGGGNGVFGTFLGQCLNKILINLKYIPTVKDMAW